ncbi:MAG: right-handed parallel beta-helix repeat-containing protein [Deltaproteobacteria bacterium]|nr:right-handed parallel beta-helix repeat-containing protein [Deltaproteobacteria bacterium]
MVLLGATRCTCNFPTLSSDYRCETAEDCAAGRRCNPGGWCVIVSDQCVGKPDGEPCNDGLFCTATDICSGGICIGAGDPCAGQPCQMSVCGANGCGPGTCGDTVCCSAAGESSASCDTDCLPTCGDDTCDAGETSATCPNDCAACGDQRCTAAETVQACPEDCATCGDGACTGSETVPSCPSDCASCASDVDQDSLPDCSDTCIDRDGDTFGSPGGGGNTCTGADCNDFVATCNDASVVATNCAIDADGDSLSDCADRCIDRDGDAFGSPGGAGNNCAAVDCDDNLSSCRANCTTDVDNDGVPDCADTCMDADHDNYGTAGDGGNTCIGPDCNDGSATCNDAGSPTANCTTNVDGDSLPDCRDGCVDPDGDGYGVAGGSPNTCTGADCDEGVRPCNADCTADRDGDARRDCDDPCIDVDNDGYGAGAACAAADCSDILPTCTTNCATDVDLDGIPDCGDTCLDKDGDGYGQSGGAGNTCSGSDCNDAVATCIADCTTDVDADALSDCADGCLDADGDGYGLPGGAATRTCAGTDCDELVSLCNADCIADTDIDGRRDCDDPCIDVDGDGYGSGPSCTGSDCDDGDLRCAADCISDLDLDGVPDCADTCLDIDGDGRGAGTDCSGTDCDDGLPTCGADCTTNTDTACETLKVVDCVEVYCTTNPAVCGSGQDCLTATTATELNARITTANSSTGVRDKLLILASFTTTASFNSLTSSTGAEIRQARGTVVDADIPGLDTRVFRLSGSNNLLEGLNIHSTGNTDTIISVAAASNTIQNCVIDGFGESGIRGETDISDNLLVYNNVIRGGTGAPGSNRAAIVFGRANNNDASGAIAGNVLVNNAMDAIQLYRNDGTFVDHNTIANNGRDGIRQTPSGDPSTSLCIRNNLITGNAGRAIYVEDGVGWNTSASCTGALAAGPVYGNAAFNNTGGLCGGQCSSCSCLPVGTFFQFSADPAYTSVIFGTADYYCVSASTLIDAGANVGRDVNGSDAGLFNSSGPDIGGRESSSEGCP